MSNVKIFMLGAGVMAVGCFLSVLLGINTAREAVGDWGNAIWGMALGLYWRWTTPEASNG